MARQYSKAQLDQIAIARRIIFMVLGFGALAYVAVWFIQETATILSWVAIALLFSFAIEPIVNWLETKGWRRGAGTGVTMAGIFLLGIVLVAAMAPVVVAQINDLIENLPAWLENLERWLQDNFDIDISLSVNTFIDQLQQAEVDVSSFASGLATNLLGLSTQVLGAVFQVLTIALFTFYMVADGPKMRRAICSVLPRDKQEVVLRTWEIAIDKTGGYFYSRILLASISAVFAFVAFSIIGVPFALPLAIWMGIVSQFIPTIGTYIASAVPLFVAVLDRPVSALWVLGFILVYQQIENYLFAPRITAKTMELHPALAFGAALAGGSIGGLMGAFLALPVVGIVQASITGYTKQYKLVESELLSGGEKSRSTKEKKAAEKA